YPNPFNSQTTLQFSLPKASEVTIDLVNLRGQRIDTIVKSVFSEGLHQVSYDAENLSSGIYYYKLNSSSHVSVKKLLILR
ncbi:T9SS type A sorting domain-containing protein, partial [candidate division KSB1 bacterium]|nr:T9SS type A sorting domain-containing protein [candidate division KSB1 bacterium]